MPCLLVCDASSHQRQSSLISLGVSKTLILSKVLLVNLIYSPSWKPPFQGRLARVRSGHCQPPRTFFLSAVGLDHLTYDLPSCGFPSQVRISAVSSGLSHYHTQEAPTKIPITPIQTIFDFMLGKVYSRKSCTIHPKPILIYQIKFKCFSIQINTLIISQPRLRQFMSLQLISISNKIK